MNVLLKKMIYSVSNNTILWYNTVKHKINVSREISCLACWWFHIHVFNVLQSQHVHHQHQRYSLKTSTVTITDKTSQRLEIKTAIVFHQRMKKWKRMIFLTISHTWEYNYIYIYIYTYRFNIYTLSPWHLRSLTEMTTILYCIVLYCIVLYCIVLYSVIRSLGHNALPLKPLLNIASPTSRRKLGEESFGHFVSLYQNTQGKQPASYRCDDLER